MRKLTLSNNEYYHIYNRGVEKREIFIVEKDYKRFLRGMLTFNRMEPIGSLERFKQVPETSLETRSSEVSGTSGVVT